MEIRLNTNKQNTTVIARSTAMVFCLQMEIKDPIDKGVLESSWMS